MGALDPRLLRRARAVRVLLAADAALGVLAALLVLAQAVLLARVVARGLRRAALADVAAPLALLVAVVVARAASRLGVRGRRQARGDRRALAAPARRSSSGGSATGRRRSTARRAPRSPQPQWQASTRSRRRSPAICRSSCSPPSSLSPCSPGRLDRPRLQALMLLTLPLVPVFMWLVGRHTERRTRERRQALARLSTHFLDVVRGLPTLRAFNRGGAQARADRAGERRVPARRRWGRSGSHFSPAPCSSSRRRSGSRSSR